MKLFDSLEERMATVCEEHTVALTNQIRDLGNGIEVNLYQKNDGVFGVMNVAFEGKTNTKPNRMKMWLQFDGGDELPIIDVIRG